MNAVVAFALKNRFLVVLAFFGLIFGHSSLAIVGSAALIGFTTAITLTAILTLPPLLCSPADLPRMH